AEIPLSYAQRRLWFLDRLAGAGATYTIPMAVRLTGALDVAGRGGARRDGVARHGSLRTGFPETPGGPRQEGLAGCETRVRLAGGGRWAGWGGGGGGGLARGSGVRVRGHLLGGGGSELVLLRVLNPMAGEGWSLAPLGRDIATPYAGRGAGGAGGLASLGV